MSQPGTMKTIILSSDDVATIVRHVGLDRLMDEVIDGLTEACLGYEVEKYSVPARAGFEYDEPDEGLLEWMPAMATGSRAMIKVVGYHPTNPDLRRLPTILSVALTFDTLTGHMIGLADATFLTAMRTGAASAVASRFLASRRSRTLGLIGCGAQAVTQLHALSRIFQFDEILIHDIDPLVSRSFVDRVAPLDLTGVEFKIAPLQHVAQSADVLCTATSIGTGQGPVFQDDSLRPWVHVNAVGSDFPGKTEVPVSVLKRSLVCPDFHSQAVKEGECQQLSAREIGPDLVELVKHAEKYSGQQERPTVFDSTGWALEDHIVVDILFRYSRELGCGTWVDLESISSDPKNPYGFIKREQSLPWETARRVVGQGRLSVVD